ncbi:hypothetical protein AcV7_002046 [Taiwanofungus camphoratus]|nr:hypothetical protein AcV7_002046 [Antrodia cinnamomea]
MSTHLPDPSSASENVARSGLPTRASDGPPSTPPPSRRGCPPRTCSLPPPSSRPVNPVSAPTSPAAHSNPTRLCSYLQTAATATYVFGRKGGLCLAVRIFMLGSVCASLSCSSSSSAAAPS